MDLHKAILAIHSSVRTINGNTEKTIVAKDKDNKEIELECAFTYDGFLINSDEFNGLSNSDAKKQISENGKILPSRITSVSQKKQRELSLSIKRARNLALI